MQYRSPEEFGSGILDERVDVYAFGQNIYTLLTGLWPYYDVPDTKKAQVSNAADHRCNIVVVFEESVFGWADHFPP